MQRLGMPNTMSDKFEEWREHHKKYHSKEFLTWWMERSAWMCFDTPECRFPEKDCSVHKKS